MQIFVKTLTGSKYTFQYTFLLIIANIS